MSFFLSTLFFDSVFFSLASNAQLIGQLSSQHARPPLSGCVRRVDAAPLLNRLRDLRQPRDHCVAVPQFLRLSSRTSGGSGSLV